MFIVSKSGFAVLFTGGPAAKIESSLPC